jgi:hypothetical protein
VGALGCATTCCGVYSCAPRTGDGGKPCRNRLDLRVPVRHQPQAKVGAEVTGECAAFTQFGCTTHVDGGRIVGRVCID